MKSRAVYFLILCILSASWLFVGCGKNSSDNSSDIAYYTCSMHPQIRADKPGDCPICGMKLTPVKKTAGSSSQAGPASPAKGVSKERKISHYTCPMHPEVRSDKPGKCPICGMDLDPVYVESHAGMDQSDVHLTPEGIRQAGVQTEVVKTRKLAKELLIFGTLGYDFNLHRDVVPLVEGRVEKQFINYNETQVKQGDPLVAIYSPEALKLQEEYLKALRERWMSTFYERKVLDSTVQLAGEKLRRIGFSDEDILNLEKKREPKAEVILRSPITGTLVGNMVHIGEIAKADQVLYHVVPLDVLWFNAQVFEPDLGLLKVGQKVLISTKAFPGEKFEGKLSYIGQALEVSNRTIPVRFDVTNADRRLLPNLSASGQLEIPLSEALLSVPNSAVLDLGSRRVVYVQMEAGFYQQRNVRIGHITPHYTQILDGVKEGEPVVTAGAFLIDAQSQLSAGGSTGHQHGEEPISSSAPQNQETVPAGHHH